MVLSAEGYQQVSDIPDAFFSICSLFWIAPDDVGPAVVVSAPADNMHVELGDHVPDGAGVDFVDGKMGFNESGEQQLSGHQMVELGWGQVMQFDTRSLRHQDKPGRKGVVHQQDVDILRLHQPHTIFA
jgi:hypothetical protein